MKIDFDGVACRSFWGGQSCGGLLFWRGRWGRGSRHVLILGVRPSTALGTLTFSNLLNAPVGRRQGGLRVNQLTACAFHVEFALESR